MVKYKSEQVVEEFINIHGRGALDKFKQQQTPKLYIYKELYDRQINFILDPSKQKAAMAGRRSGKSLMAAYYLVDTCWQTPNTITSFTGITRTSARDTIWDYIKSLNDRYKLGAVSRGDDLIWTFPNSSKIYIMGADKIDETRKHLGKFYSLAIVDECGDFKPHLEELVTKVLGPTLLDYDGTICLLGTPGGFCGGFWYDITTNNNNWSVHKDWNIFDNPKLPQWRGNPNYKSRVDEVLASVRIKNNWDERSPQYIRQYLGQWVAGSSWSVYNEFEYNSCVYTTLPEEDYHYLIGVDFGITDATAIVVGAYSRNTNNFYIVDDFKQTEMSPEEVAINIKRFYDLYSPEAVIVDGSGKAFIKQFESMYQLPLTLSEKKDKVSFIKLLNDDFRRGRLKINKRCQDLLTELNMYQWKDKALGVLPDTAEDHCLDALLYVWRYSTHYAGKAQPRKPTLEDGEAYEEYLVELELKKLKENNDLSYWEKLTY